MVSPATGRAKTAAAPGEPESIDAIPASDLGDPGLEILVSADVRQPVEGFIKNGAAPKK